MADGDIQYAKEILQPCLYNYPKGVIFLFYAGRIEEITGNMDQVGLYMYSQVVSHKIVAGYDARVTFKQFMRVLPYP